MSSLRMLFVDDEPSIRLTLPEILRLHGHDVEVASTVAEALTAISLHKFDVLISDLNIGNAGDGFTVVSAMRRTQPQCVTLILTGYPGFETALQAIRSQVDDYLVKPTQVEQLVETIERKLKERTPHHPVPVKRVNEILKEWQQGAVDRAVHSLTARRKTPRKTIRESLQDVFAALICFGDPAAAQESFAAGERYGTLRREQGSSVDDLFDEFRALERTAYEIVQENLLAADVSNVVPDLKAFNDHVQNVLMHAVNAYLEDSLAA
jgi:YesN/AraC family two-component response regulator